MDGIEMRERFRFVAGNVDPRHATNKRVPATLAAQGRELLERQVAIFQTWIAEKL
jgi:hypothetical protein